MKKYAVKEGNTGVLYLMDEQGRETIYQPDCDLDKAQKLLYEFYELKNADGVKIKDAFQRNGIDWFPTAVSLLYWGFFFQFIKYKPLVESCINGQKDFTWNFEGKFATLIQNIKGASPLSPKKILKKLYHPIIFWRNYFVARRQGDILFFRYSLNDFRTNEIYANLVRKFQVTQIAGATWQDLLRHFFDSTIYFHTGSMPHPAFNFNVPDNTSRIHKAATQYCLNVINSHYHAYQKHQKLLRNYKYKLFCGIDDANFVYPVLYAAQDAGIKTLGIQHGGYMRRHEAYILHGIERYRWYDHVMVWGKYWKDVILKHSSNFAQDFHILASNKHLYDYTPLPKKSKGKTILIPYEFLSDSIRVGQYIKQFISKGFEIYFKPRPDEPIEEQLRAYALEDTLDKIHIMSTISPEAMADIDIIAGTQTTMLFDLLPYNKPIWILDTSFRLMHDMVEDCLARLVTEKDMERIDAIYHEAIKHKRVIDTAYISGNKPVVAVVEEYLTV